MVRSNETRDSDPLAPPHTSLTTLKGGLPLASRDGVETRGPVGAAGGGAGAAEGGAGGAGAFAEGAGAVAGGADAVAGAPDGVADGGDGAAAGGDGIGAGGVAVASLDCRKMCSLTKELTDDIALSTLWRTAATPSKYPKACWPDGTKPRKA